MPAKRGRPRTVITGRQQAGRKELYAPKTFIKAMERAAKSAGLSWNAWATKALKAAMEAEP